MELGIPLIKNPDNVPEDGNDRKSMTEWTSAERLKVDLILRSWARWEVDYINGFIKSRHCEGTTISHDKICPPCQEIASDQSFKRSVRRLKLREASLSPEERRQILERRDKYAQTDMIRQIGARSFSAKLSDPVLFDIHDSLKTGKPEDAFLRPYKSAKEGKLSNYERFIEVCDVLEDRVRRETSGNDKLKYGIRYSPNYLDFMIAMRGYGQNSNRQYEIFCAEFAGPSVRYLRTLVTKSTDALQNPYLIFENVARVKRYIDSVNYKGPIVVGLDCTEVRQRLNISTQCGAHVLGTTFNLADVEVDDAEDIDEIVACASKKKAFASQTRAILARIPLRHCPPIVIAILPTDGKETVEDIHMHHLKLQKMAAQLSIPFVALTADGAASELSAQSLMDHEKSELPALKYDYPLYGIHLQAPVFIGAGPTISITDPPHSRKTCRNQPQYGTHTASLGIGFLVHQSFIDLYEISGSGLVLRDVENVDKQDDGAARRIFHTQALTAATSQENGVYTIVRPNFEGLFCYLFIVGTLFEAWMSPSMKVEDRVLAVYSPARSFISPASFHIFNRLCDTLVLLALAYAR